MIIQNPKRTVAKTPSDTLKQFKKMYVDMYDVQLTKDEVVEYGNRLVMLVRTVYGKDLPKRFDNKEKKSNT